MPPRLIVKAATAAMMITMTTIAPTISSVPEDEEVEVELDEDELDVDVVGTALLELLLLEELDATMELELELLEVLSGCTKNHA